MVSWKTSAIFIIVVIVLLGLCAIITGAVLFWFNQSSPPSQASIQPASSQSTSSTPFPQNSSPSPKGTPTPTRISGAILPATLTPYPLTVPETPTLTPPPAPENTPSSQPTPTAYPTNTLGPSTPSPTPAPTFTPAIWKACDNARESRLYKGMKASVSTDPPLPNRVRNAAGMSSSYLGLIEPGEEVDILDGPVCSDNMVWWKVDNRKGLIGWTSEGDLATYWLVPVR